VLDGQVCLLKIFRHALRQFVLELPRGFGVDGQTDEQNAIRELKEEIGGEIKNIFPLGCMSENSGLGDGYAVLFFAEIEGNLNSTGIEEGIEKIVLVPTNEFLCMVRDGNIDDSFTLAATARATLRGYI
jgi:ADP-ribose pyrophosphatase